MNNPESLIVGNPYFMISYYDEQGVIPEIETLIYVGKNLFGESDDGDRWFFQSPFSYLTQGPFNILPPDDHGVYQMKTDYLEAVYDLEELAKRLLDPFYDY